MMKRCLLIVFNCMFLTALDTNGVAVSANEETSGEVEASSNIQEILGTTFSSIYLALGFGGSFYENKLSGLVGSDRQDHFESNVNRFLGILAFGVGKALYESFYVGAEMLCDFSKTKNKQMEFGNLNVDAKISPIIPSLGLRLGYFNRNWETMFYAKIAASHARTTFKNDNYSGKIAKIAPAIAVGVERAFSKKFSARLECEYRFSSNRETGSIPTPEVKAKSAHGINVRALVTYHVNSNQK